MVFKLETIFSPLWGADLPLILECPTDFRVVILHQDLLS